MLVCSSVHLMLGCLEATLLLFYTPCRYSSSEAVEDPGKQYKTIKLQSSASKTEIDAKVYAKVRTTRTNKTNVTNNIVKSCQVTFINIAQLASSGGPLP